MKVVTRDSPEQSDQKRICPLPMIRWWSRVRGVTGSLPLSTTTGPNLRL